MKKLIDTPLTLSKEAMNQLHLIRKEKNIPEDQGLRIGVSGGGCAGQSYIFGFDVQKERDEVYDIQGFKVFIEKAHLIYLLGMEIDWVENADSKGFSFNSSNEKQ